MPPTASGDTTPGSSCRPLPASAYAGQMEPASGLPRVRRQLSHAWCTSCSELAGHHSCLLLHLLPRKQATSTAPPPNMVVLVLLLLCRQVCCMRSSSVSIAKGWCMSSRSHS